MAIRKCLGSYSGLLFISRHSFLFCKVKVQLLQIAGRQEQLTGQPKCFELLKGTLGSGRDPSGRHAAHTQRGMMSLHLPGGLVLWEDGGLCLPADLSSNPSPLPAVGCQACSLTSLSSL